MDKFLDFLKSLFLSQPQYGLGAEPNPPDKRDIHLSSFQLPVALPYEYYTDISMLPVMDQKSYGTCVGQAEGTILAYYDYLENKNADVSRRHIYANCKKVDGFAGQGTYPRVASAFIANKGATTGKFLPDDNTLPYDKYLSFTETAELLADAFGRRANYALVAIDANAMKQAIYQNKLMTVSIFVDWSVFKSDGNIVLPPRSIAGSHRICLYGWKGNTFYFRNSWTENWGEKGNGHFDMNSYQNYLMDGLVYTDIPNAILENAQSQQYIFTKEMRVGMTDFQVTKLQQRLGILPATGYFGPVTKARVIEFQLSRGLKGDGSVGPLTMFELNKKISKLDAWCEAIKAMEGALPSRNNPGNLRFIGQQYAVNDRGFCKFDTYAHGYAALKKLLVNACTGKSSVYKPTMNLYDFYAKYAPDSDGNNSRHYAEFVANRIGVKVGDPISNLII